MLQKAAKHKPYKPKLKRRLDKPITKLLQTYHESVAKLPQAYYEAVTGLSKIFHKPIAKLWKVQWLLNARFIRHADVTVTHFTNKKNNTIKSKIRR